eukprot:Hpha_TRINITY_DN2831_c0_g1::TRINITY_DN2831_c0_g1_i1::g.171417::m.171417
MLRPKGTAAHFDPSGVVSASTALRGTNLKPHDVLYRPSDAVVRVARVRNVLFTNELDALLFIGGVDSRENPGCIKAINYILCGAYGNVLATPMLCDESFEDTVVLVYRGGIRVYTTPPACEKVTRVLSACPGVEIFCLDERHFKNQDLFEDHKIATYQKMVKGFKKVGFALPQKVPDMVRAQVVEKWPLIQAHALDNESGQRTFFTREHEVTDVTGDLEFAYRAVNSHELCSALLTQAPLLQRHWEDSLLFAGHALSKGIATKEVPPHEPLVSYFEYGTMRRTGIVRTWGVLPPQFLSGEATSSKRADGESTVGADALHCTLEASDPQSPLFAARTYTLSSGCLPSLDAFGRASVFTKGAIPVDGRRHRPRSVRRVCELYTTLGHTLDELTDELRLGKGFGSGDKQRDQQFGQRAFTRVADLLGVDVSKGVGSLTVSLTRHDLGPYTSEGAPSGGRTECSVAYLRLHLGGVLAPEDGSVLGGLLYGDTLALSGPAPCDVLNLTRSIPQCALVGSTAEEKAGSDLVIRALSRCKEAYESPDLTDELRPRLQEGVPLGEYLGQIPEGASVYFPGGGFGSGGVLSNRVEAFSNGLVLFTAAGEAMEPLLLSDLPQVELFTPMGLEESTFIAFRRGAGRWALPAAVGQELASKSDPKEGRGDLVVVCLQPRSPGKRFFAAEVLGKWKPKVAMVDAAGPEFSRHPRAEEFAQEWRRSGSAPYTSVGEYRPFNSDFGEGSRDPRVEEAARLRAELLKRFPLWDTFRAASTVSEADDTLRDRMGGHTAPLHTPRRVGGGGGPSEGELVVHVVSGYPGSGKHKLVDAVQRAVQSAPGGHGAKKVNLGVVEYKPEDGYDLDGAGLYGRIRNAMG